MGRSQIRVWGEMAGVVVFVAALLLPGFDTIAHLDRTRPPEEKRALASRPALPRTLTALAALPRAYDAYFADHFGFRSLLARLSARIAFCWLHTKPPDQAEVMVERDNWLEYTGNDTLAFIEGRNRFTDPELQRWVTSLRQRQRWLAERGILYLVVLVPGKFSIYPEQLPAWIRPPLLGNRGDQLVAALRAYPEVSLIDLRTAVREAKPIALLYQPTDTHWNTIGAYFAYHEIMKTVARWFPGSPPTPQTAFDVAWGNDPGGDLAVLLNVQGLVNGVRPWIALRGGAHFRTVPDPTYAKLRRWLNLEEPVVTECPGAPIPRAVVFRDSYANALLPHLSEHFGRAVYLWIQDFDSGVIDRERPSIVIQEWAERLLSVISPANPPEVAAVALPTTDQP